MDSPLEQLTNWTATSAVGSRRLDWDPIQVVGNICLKEFIGVLYYDLFFLIFLSMTCFILCFSYADDNTILIFHKDLHILKNFLEQESIIFHEIVGK